MSELDKLESVHIDPDGVFKYILIEAKNSKDKKTLVWGDAQCEYHADIFEKCEQFCSKSKLKIELKCLGGGRINHSKSNKKLLIYGYSVGFGKADHSITEKILKEHYPNYEISCSDEGY